MSAQAVVDREGEMAQDQNELARGPVDHHGQLMFDQACDLNDGKPWTGVDIHNLQSALNKGYSIELAAAYLSRRTTMTEVEEMARDLGWLPSPAIAPG